jgi:hypothetical protein
MLTGPVESIDRLDAGGKSHDLSVCVFDSRMFSRPACLLLLPLLLPPLLGFPTPFPRRQLTAMRAGPGEVSRGRLLANALLASGEDRWTSIHVLP